MSTAEESSARGLRVVVLGATGNLGVRVVERLGADHRVGSILGVARRLPEWSPAKTTWARADVAESTELAALFDGADAVVHLAWLFQPSRRPRVTWHTNAVGSDRVFRAAAAAGVPALVHASSVAAYSPGPKDRGVDETWPTHGWPEAAYCREKAYVERLLDRFECAHPGIRVVRMRPGIVVMGESAAEQRRIFAGPFVPDRAWGPVRLPFVPDVPGLRFQAVHTDDVADAFCQAVIGPVHGAFNLAAEPTVDARLLARLTGTRAVPMPDWPLRAAARAAWRLRLIPAPAQLLDAVLEFPLMDTSRARNVLGWSPRYTSVQAMQDFLDGLREGRAFSTPPLRRRLRGGGRLREVATGVGGRP
ncbi:NAD-dependent epimerase/dehydratase family protein [Streptomyces sp. 8N706]|uniref:NAD-dependent epimerase/dehydratase family protein n=1 Tax=Streptomyces sp. 8N706 TaxID=3457416 RepID=UPI003FD1AE4F